MSLMTFIISVRHQSNARDWTRLKQNLSNEERKKERTKEKGSLVQGERTPILKIAGVVRYLSDGLKPDSCAIIILPRQELRRISIS